MSIFSFTVTSDRKPLVQNEDLENRDLKKGNGLEKWQLLLVIGGVTFSILLVTVLVICGVNRVSKNRAIRRMNANHGSRNQPQSRNLDVVIVNDHV